MEIILETFVFFSCLMFWVVFFHKKGTLTKLKKIESSIEAKIHILEDLLDRYQKYQPTNKSKEDHSKELSLALSETPTSDEIKQDTKQETVKAKKSLEIPAKMISTKEMFDSVKKIPISFSPSQLKDKVVAVAQKAKAFAPLKEDDIDTTPDEEKVFEKSFSTEGQGDKETHVFQQKIEDMLKKANPSAPVAKTTNAVAKTMAPNIPLPLEKEMLGEDDLVVEKFKLAPVNNNEQKEKISVPRTKPVESFEDIINLSKAYEKESKN